MTNWSENTSQLFPFCLKTTSIFTEILIGPSKILIGSCTYLNVDSSLGSCSGSTLKYSPWLLLRSKIQTPAGVHSGSVIISEADTKSIDTNVHCLHKPSSYIKKRFTTVLEAESQGYRHILNVIVR